MDSTGLAATTWDDFAGDGPFWEHDLFLRLIEQSPGKALDVGCGTGRLMLPYLASGIDVEGVDSSEEMLAICRRKAFDRGLTPVLHHQRMQALDLPGRYSTIIIPGGSFHLIVDRDEAFETLRRFHHHIETDGVLAMTLDDPGDELAEGPLPRLVSRRTAVRRSDGAELRQHRTLEHVDRARQTTTTSIRYRVVGDGTVLEEEHHTMRMRLYFADELRTMLETAGFRDIERHADRRAEDAGDAAWRPVVVAIRSATP